jgi:hypothetical protein
MSNINQIYYFLIGDYHNKSELGYYLCDDNSISEKDKQYIISKATETYTNFGEKDVGSKECKVLDNNLFAIFHLITSSGTFYLSIASINSIYMDQNNLMFEFFEDIEHQGIKKLIDNSTGKLSRVGIQNLKFNVENNNNKMKNMNPEEGEGNKIKNLNNQINDINNEMQNSVKNMIVSVSEMNNLNSKSAEIKDMSYKFQQGAYDIEKRMKRRSLLIKIGLGVIAIIVIYAIIKFIL